MGCSFSDTTKRKEALQCKYNIIYIASNKKQRDLEEAVKIATQKQIFEDDFLGMEVELSIACQNLPNYDTLSLTDAACAIYLQQKNGMWKRIGETECITDSLNPKFVKSVDLRYYFEERQRVKVEVYDLDDFSPNVDICQNFIGNVEFLLSDLIRAKKQTLHLPINNPARTGKPNGFVIIEGEEKKNSTNNLIKLKLNGTCDGSKLLFYRLYRNKELDGEQYIPVVESEVARKSNNLYQWDQLEMLASSLVRDDLNRLVKLELFEWRKNGTHLSMGFTTFQVGALITQKNPLTIQKAGRSTATIHVDHISFIERFTFLDYLFGGCEIALIIGVDFTLSNGKPNDPSSLHYFDMRKNEYLQAIQHVGGILESYDTDKQIPVYGFGAKLPPSLTKRPSHCFAMNGNIFDPEINRIEGVVESYKHALHKIQFYGPTYFHDLVKYANDMAEYDMCTQDEQKYTILLLITDGNINDMEPTIDEIVRGGRLPISIIIVGVGDEDFTEMVTLDADDEPLYSHKYRRQMERDIVQFVPFSEFKNNPEELARQTLEEIPTQITELMTMKGIRPGQAMFNRQASDLSRANSFVRSKSMSRSVDKPDFFTYIKNKFKDELRTQGCSDILVEQIVEAGLPEASQECFFEMANRGYSNPLIQP